MKKFFFLYFLFSALFVIYSYFLVDPNFTLVNHPLWTVFRNFAVSIGYFKRGLSLALYLVFLFIFFILYLFAKKNYQKINPIQLALLIGVIFLFSYPFLSHDFFNYLFDAKILTYYGKNPYLYKALDFPDDNWTRFMHWTHRTYPYGPVFLLISLLPSFLSFGKFILAFFFFKITWSIFYLLAVYYLNKINRKWAVIFATPLILIEGLVNNHNDLIATTLGIIGIYYLLKSKNFRSRFILLLSAGIKYLTLPIIFLTKKNQKINILVFLGISGLILYLTIFGEIQAWYFLSFFIFLPFFGSLIEGFDLLFFGLLLSYYPYIYLGGWDSVEKLQIKHIIILIFFGLSLVHLIFNKEHIMSFRPSHAKRDAWRNLK
jgi:hypothetical protein